MEMERSYLIQRLLKPTQFGVELPFGSFGCGLVAGGLSKKAVEVINGMWTFDYMGSSEFEFEAVPEALNTIINYRKKDKAITGQVQLQKPVFYLCEKDMKSGVEDVIGKLAKKELRTKEPVYLQEVLEARIKTAESDFDKKYYKSLVEEQGGWLELDNGFMFFVCPEMFRKTKELFELK